MFSLPIPTFDPNDALHASLAKLAEEAVHVAASVALPPGLRFITARKRIRKSLTDSGLMTRIDEAVAGLLGSSC